MITSNELNQVIFPYFDISLQAENELHYTPITAGCINDCYKVTGKDNRIFFVKANTTSDHAGILGSEKTGLQYLETKQVIKTPAIAGFHSIKNGHVLILEWIQQATPGKHAWQQLGKQLAALHQVSSKQFGFFENNYIGSLPQLNIWKETWFEFFLQNRLNPQIQLAVHKNLLPASTGDKIIKCWEKQAVWFTNEKPSLLHGDLWNGNILFDENAMPVLADPSVYYGSRHMDMAMTTLFGGFDPAFYESYHHHFPLPANHKQIWDICNLYPLLVHVNLFGRSYLPNVLSILKKYN